MAIVTGAGRGIGRAIALSLVDSGYRVVLAGRSQDALAAVASQIASMGGAATVVPTDVTDEQQVAALVETTTATFDRLDLLVCNSGVGGPSAPIAEIAREEWEATFAVNVTGAFLCCKAVAPVMSRAGGGNIVIIGSMTGKRPLTHRTPYAASKTALIGLTRTLAHELGPAGVRVNLVSPGAVEGERIEWVISQQAEAQGIGFEDAKTQFTAASPLNRLVAPDEVAAAVAFLASDAAASITGEDLNVSGGLVTY